ncbi:MAG: hypothetical protein WBO46_24885 [Caldilineaceae bacterium]
MSKEREDKEYEELKSFFEDGDSNKESDSLKDIFEETPSPDQESISEKEYKTEERKENMKNIGIKFLKVIGVLIVVIFLGNSFVSNSKKDDSEEKARQEETERIQSIKDGLLQQYNATDFNKADFSFSEDIQKELGKSFFFDGSIYDIFQKDGKRFIVLTGYDYIGTFEANEDQIKYIRNKLQKDDLFSPDIFFVVRLDDVSRLSFETEHDKDGEDVWVYTEPSDDFLLRGELLEVKFPE